MSTPAENKEAVRLKIERATALIAKHENSPNGRAVQKYGLIFIKLVQQVWEVDPSISPLHVLQEMGRGNFGWFSMMMCADGARQYDREESALVAEFRVNLQSFDMDKAGRLMPLAKDLIAIQQE